MTFGGQSKGHICHKPNERLASKNVTEHGMIQKDHLQTQAIILKQFQLTAFDKTQITEKDPPTTTSNAH